MIDAVQLGERLRDARIRRGLSQQAVADMLKLPRTAVTNIEMGARSVSTMELSQLATLYNCSAASFLEEGDAAEAPYVVLHRALEQATDDPSFGNAIDDLLALCREGAALRAMLDERVEENLPSYASKVGSAGEAVRQGELVAREERRRLGLGNAPIGNIAGLISDQGIWAAACELPADMSGVFSHDRQSGLVIIIQADHGAARRLFSYAHEYGHALFDRAEPYRFTSRQNAAELVEKRANSFAAAFLMPSSGVEDQLRQLNKGQPSRQAQAIYNVAGDSADQIEIRPRPGSQAITYQDVVHIARHFAVSYDAAVWRMKNLGYLSAGETDGLINQREAGKYYMQVLHFRELFSDERVPAEEKEKELRSQIARLSVEAYRREAISQARLRELATKLNISADDLVNVAHAAFAPKAM